MSVKTRRKGEEGVKKRKSEWGVEWGKGKRLKEENR